MGFTVPGFTKSQLQYDKMNQIVDRGHIMEARQIDGELMTEAEYLAFEETSEFRHEYASGRVIEMSGVSSIHIDICMNVSANLHNQVRGTDCRAAQSDMRVQIKKKHRTAYRYPDVSVVCGERQFVEGVGSATLTNPTVLIEVLSASTASVDRIQKLEEYRQIDTLQDYLIIAQDAIWVAHYQRQTAKTWTYTVYTDSDDMINLPAIDCTLLLLTVYENIVFPIDSDDETTEE
ncbi:MAG: Uma2 family endonuclease [Aggregatilineales bacterium]